MAKHRGTRKLVEAHRVDDGRSFRLERIDPEDHRGIHSRQDAELRLAADIRRLESLQERLYAQDRWAVLLVFQGMDGSGKDGTIKHVMSGLNPQGCQVYS